MAIANGADLGGNNGTAVTTRTITLLAAVPAGGVIYIEVGSFHTGGATQTHSITGTGGLTWVEENTGTTGNIRGSLFRAVAPAGLAISTVLTVTISLASDVLVRAYYWAGIDNSTPTRTTGGAASAVAATTTGTLAASAGDAIIAGSWSDGAAASWTATGPAVERIDVNIAGQGETVAMAEKLSVSGSDALAGAWNAATTSFTSGVAAIPSTGAVAARPAQSRRVVSRGRRAAAAVFG